MGAECPKRLVPEQCLNLRRVLLKIVVRPIRWSKLAAEHLG